MGMSVDDLLTLSNESLSFIVSKEDSGNAWGRAQAFVAQHSSMKIQTVSDYVVQTFKGDRRLRLNAN